MAASPVTPVIAFALVLVTLVVLFFGGRAAAKAWRLWLWSARVRRTPLVGVAEAREGEAAAFHGVAEPLGRLRAHAPVTGVECLAHSHFVGRIKWTGAREDALGNHESSGGVRFLLRDETGAIEVEPHGARIELEPDVRDRGNLLALRGPDTLRDARGDSIHARVNRPLARFADYEEGVLRNGDKAYVRGRVVEGVVKAEVLISDRPRPRTASDLAFSASWHTLKAIAMLGFLAFWWVLFVLAAR